MDQLGFYQNDVSALASLDIKSYERIFKIFKASEEGKEFYFYNILKKIEFPELDDTIIEYYDVLARMPLSIVSYKVYGDMKSWWIIYLLNKDKFEGVPFWVEGGTQLKYIKDSVRSSIYLDITQSTVFGGRHY